jgi:hypothetical protein
MPVEFIASWQGGAMVTAAELPWPYTTALIGERGAEGPDVVRTATSPITSPSMNMETASRVVEKGSSMALRTVDLNKGFISGDGEKPDVRAMSC